MPQTTKEMIQIMIQKVEKIIKIQEEMIEFNRKESIWRVDISG